MDGEGDAAIGAWKEAMERWSVVSFIHVLLVMQGEDPEKQGIAFAIIDIKTDRFYVFRQIVDLAIQSK